MAAKVRFKSTIEQARGAGATVALVPAEVIQALGGLKQKRAFGWLNGIDFMTATFPFKGTLYVGVPKAARVAAAQSGAQLTVLVAKIATRRTPFVALARTTGVHGCRRYNTC